MQKYFGCDHASGRKSVVMWPIFSSSQFSISHFPPLLKIPSLSLSSVTEVLPTTCPLPSNWFPLAGDCQTISTTSLSLLSFSFHLYFFVFALLLPLVAIVATGGFFSAIAASPKFSKCCMYFSFYIALILVCVLISSLGCSLE